MNCYLRLEGCEEYAVGYGYSDGPIRLNGQRVCASCKAHVQEFVPFVPEGMEGFRITLGEVSIGMVGRNWEDARRRLEKRLADLLGDFPSEKPRK